MKLIWAARDEFSGLLLKLPQAPYINCSGGNLGEMEKNNGRSMWQGTIRSNCAVRQLIDLI